MEENNFKGQKDQPVYTNKMRAGRKRTYFFDVRETKNGDFYISITESKKRLDGGYDRHKIYLYKEDFNKFMEALNGTVAHVKTELMPEYDYDEFARRQEEYDRQRAEQLANPTAEGSTEANNESSSESYSSPNPPKEENEKLINDENANSSNGNGGNDSPAGPPANDDDLKW